MTARPFGEIAAEITGERRRRSSQPVRRNSRYAGEEGERRLWRPLGRDARRLIALRLQAAEHFERTNRLPGKRNGPLGHVGLEVLRALYRIVDFKTGRLEPAIATICEKIRRSRAAVVSALARLKAQGFLDWVRRSEPTGNEGAGPQVRQITNAYGFDMPARAAAWVARLFGTGPTPACEQDRQNADRAEVDAMLARAAPDDFATFVTDDPALAEIIASGLRSFDRSASSPNGQKPGTEI